MAGRIPTSEIRKRMSEALDMLSEPDQWIVITRHGEPVAAMVSVNLLWSLLETREDGAPRLSYTPTGQIPDAIETGAERPPERKSAFGSMGAPARTLRVGIAHQEDMPDLDDLLRRIDRLRSDLSDWDGPVP